MNGLPFPENEKKPEPLSRQERGSSLKPSSIRFQFDRLHWSTKTGFSGGSTRRSPYQITIWSWMAALIDGLLLVGMSSLFAIVFAKIMNSDFGEILRQIRGEQSFIWLFVEILLASSWFYMILMRSSFGQSIGEWACDLRLGPPQAEEKPKYLLRVIWRSSLIVLTGFIFLPLASLFFGQDLAGKLSGLRLFSLK